METCYRKRVRLLTAIKIQTPVCIFLLPPEKDPKFPHKTLPALSRVLSLRRRLSGHRCVIQNSFEYFCPSGAAFRGFGHVMQNSFGYFCPSEAGFRVLRYVMQNNFKCFFSPERLSGSQVHDCKSVSGIFVPPEPAVHILSPFKTNNKYIQEKSPEPPEPRNRLNKNRR